MKILNIQKGINDKIHFWLNDDGVAGGLAGDDFYKSNLVRNVQIDDGGKDWGKEGNPSMPSFIKAHGFIYYPTMIQNSISNQNIIPFKPTNQDE